MEKGDMVLIMDGRFKGEEAVIVEPSLWFEDNEVALARNGQHMKLGDPDLSRLEVPSVAKFTEGDFVIITGGHFKGQEAVVVKPASGGSRNEIRLLKTKGLIDVQDSHLSRV
ncbi:MAG TPA: KOW motif-containing protein [Acidimicrobiales bacterium]|nr:KOW motif-containing protein [Acidimicrobiales bacterium]